MDVILPVAGLGSRLRPQTWSKPKPLVSVAGKPMLAHVLDRILPLEPEKIVFITGYLGDQIEMWARNYYPDQHLEFVIQPEMLGQTDAIIRTRPYCNDVLTLRYSDSICRGIVNDFRERNSVESGFRNAREVRLEQCVREKDECVIIAIWTRPD